MVLVKTLKATLSTAHDTRTQRHNKTEADALVQSLMEKCSAAREDTEASQLVRKASKCMEDQLFCGDLRRTSAALQHFLRRPTVRELLRLDDGLLESLQCGSKRDRAKKMVLDSLHDYFTVVMATKGPRTKDNQHAMESALTALVSAEVFDERLGRELENLLGVSYAMMRKCVAQRATLDQTKEYRWATRAEYCNKISGAAITAVRDALHMDEFSRVDNAKKGTKQVFVGNGPAGEVLYDKHEHREVLGNRRVLLKKLMAHPISAEILRLYPQKKKDGTPYHSGKISRQILKEAWCPCLRLPGVPNETSCKICSMFEENVRLYNKKMATWYQKAGEKQPSRHAQESSGVGVTQACGACCGLCHIGGPWRTWCSSPLKAQEFLMCKPVHYPWLDLAPLDPKTDTPRADGPFPYKHPPTACHHLGRKSQWCKECGFDARFKRCNDGRPVTCTSAVDEDNPDSGTVPCEIVGCPVVLNHDPETWHVWATVPDGVTKEGKARTRTEWIEHHGTRFELYVAMKHAFYEYAQHKLYVGSFHHNWHRQQRAMLHMPALTGIPAPGGPHMMCGSDFSTVLSLQRQFTVTCEHAEGLQCHVRVFSFDPALKFVKDLPDGKQKRWLQKRGVTQRVFFKTAVVYTYSERKPDAVFQATAFVAAMGILNTGKLPADIRGEAYHEGKRLLGGNPKYRLKLASNLEDATAAVPFAKAPIKSGVQRRDGCAAQVQGCRALGFIQDIYEWTGMKLIDKRPHVGEGKWLYDMLGDLPQKALNKHATGENGNDHENDWDHGGRNASMWLADAMRKPSGHLGFLEKKWTTNHFIHLYIPGEDGFSESVAPPRVTWPGTDSFYSFKTRPAAGMGALNSISGRLQDCTCDPCAEGRFHNCLSNAGGLRDLYGDVAMTRIPLLKVSAKAVTRQHTGLDAVRAMPVLKSPSKVPMLQRLVIVRVHSAEKQRNDAHEPYFLARPAKPCWVNAKSGPHCGTWYDKGWIMTQFRWFKYLRTEDGERVYKILNGPGSLVTMGVNCIVGGFPDLCFARSQRDAVVECVLSGDLHDAIISSGYL
jgi:hypothetical protein